MKKIFLAIAIASLVACAKVPYSDDGQVILAPAANFAETPSEGPLDEALTELIVRIEPGQETLRAVAVGTTAAVALCQLSDCRVSNGVRAGVLLPLGTQSPSSALQSQLAGHERTQDQVRQLADLSEAFAAMAERDARVLSVATDTSEVESWEALYRARYQSLERGQQASIETRKKLAQFRQQVQRQVSGRSLVKDVVELEQISNAEIARIDAAKRRVLNAIEDLDA